MSERGALSAPGPSPRPGEERPGARPPEPGRGPSSRLGEDREAPGRPLPLLSGVPPAAGADPGVRTVPRAEEPADSVIQLVDRLIRRALADGASDIHLEPRPDGLLVRTRVDGFLVRTQELPRRLQPAVVSRIKIMASLDIAERRMPQDGHIRLRLGGGEAYLRVSTLPCRHGEKVVLRLFDPGRDLLSLEQLGFGPAQLAAVEGMLARAHGMILVTGPTGCGKTTTLRACIHRLRAEHLNIVSVEDPIEYEIDGITQVQIHERAGLTFAECLRAILRQDPDIVMLGEIRDAETAEVACRAALTGHLLLSTMHTNDAASAILRLANLGVDPYLVGASIIGVIAQRLVRLVCRACRIPAPPPPALAAEYPVLADAADALVRGRGCPACRQTGYRGRTGIYEILALAEAPPEPLGGAGGGSRLVEAMGAARLPTLFDDGLRKVAAGLTTLEEVLRVAPPPRPTAGRDGPSGARASGRGTLVAARP